MYPYRESAENRRYWRFGWAAGYFAVVWAMWIVEYATGLTAGRWWELSSPVSAFAFVALLEALGFSAFVAFPAWILHARKVGAGTTIAAFVLVTTLFTGWVGFIEGPHWDLVRIPLAATVAFGWRFGWFTPRRRNP